MRDYAITWIAMSHRVKANAISKSIMRLNYTRGMRVRIIAPEERKVQCGDSNHALIVKSARRKEERRQGARFQKFRLFRLKNNQLAIFGESCQALSARQRMNFDRTRIDQKRATARIAREIKRCRRTRSGI